MKSVLPPLLRRCFRKASISPRSHPVWLAALVWFLAGASLVLADITLVPKGAVWKYLDNGSDQGTAWRAPGFNDGAWASGPAQLGYGDLDEATVVGFGPNSSAKYITTYFRRAFTVADPAQFTGLNLSVLRDDGVVVYLNGTEVYRNNLPTGTITAATLAPTAISGTEESTTFLTASLGTSTLVSGNNVLAVEIHQQSGTSSDISFDLQLVGVQPGLPNVTRGPYLQNVTPTSITLRWRTSINSDSRVRYGTSSGNLDLVAANATLKTEHAVTLTGLAPNTLYYYAIGNSTADLAAGVDYFFYTAPPAGTDQPMRFWVLGDAGTASTGQIAVRNAYQNFNGTRYTDLILLLGDNAYSNGTDSEYQTKLFDIYPTTFRATPSFSTVGNHDTAQLTNPDINTTPYFLIFNHPTAAEGGGVASGTEKYYSFNYGNVHFVCLDSMTSDKSTTGPMLTWLQQDLAQNTADWLVAFFHHPPYTKGSHDSDTETFLVQMRQNALPILESYGVDLVLCGHSHSYERSYLLNGHYGLSGTLTTAMKLDAGSGREEGTGAYAKANIGPNSNQGAVYVVPGSAGQISGGTLNHPAMFVSLNKLGSFVIDVNNTRLDAKFITDTGTIDDWFTLVKGPQGNQPPSVSISSPAADSSFNTGQAVLLTAAALDSDGSVAQVDFYANGYPVGSDTTEPFSVSWTPGTAGSYALTAVATDNLGAQATSAPVNVTVVDPPTAPSAPTNLSGSAASATSVSLTWTDNATNEQGFRIERAPNGGSFAPLATTGANATGYTDNTASPNSTYQYRVLAFNAVGDSGAAGPVTVTTPDLPPAAPTNLAGNAASATSVNLTWTDNATNEQGFRIERAPNGGSFTQIATTGANATGYTDSTASPNSTYQYRVLAFNAAGDSGFAGPVTVTTPDVAPAAPSNLAGNAASATSVNLTWTDNANNEQGFRIERAPNGGSFAPLATTGANASGYTDNTASPNSTYQYRVLAFNAAGDSGAAGPVTVTTPDLPPAAPTNLAGSAASATSVNLTWTDNATNEQGFRIERAPNGGSFAPLATTGANATGYTDNTVAAGATYQYRVLAFNAAGDSGAAGPVTVTTPDVAPAAPSNLAGNAASATSVDLTWTDNASNEQGFRIERAPNGGSFAPLATTGANATGYTDTTASPNSTYQYRVLAFNAVGDSGAAGPVTVTTPDLPPAAPTNLAGNAASATSVNLTWTDNATNEQGFRIERAPNGGSFVLLATTGANATGYTDTTVTAGNTYQYRVQAFNAAGSSAYAGPVTVTTPQTLPNAPTSLTATSPAKKRIQLAWVDNSSNETGFKIERSATGASGSWSQIATVGANVTSYSNTGLTSGLTYFYRVRATNAAGDSAYSNTASARVR